jgi:glycine cleavage system H protein
MEKPKPLVFLMGRSPAFLPTDRLYARTHFWALPTARGYRLGLSSYGVRLLGEIRHLQWSAELGNEVAAAEAIGYVEASKATSDLYAPMAGRVGELNRAAVERPGLVNASLYDEGWLLEIDGRTPSLLSPEEYLAHLEAVWPLAQRLLKGAKQP